MNTYYRMIKLIFWIFHCVSSQSCQVRGESNALSAAKIIAANHANVTDGLFLPFVFTEKLHFLIQGYAFNIPLLGWLFRKSGQIPVDPGHKNQSLDQATKLLELGKTVVIFRKGG
jgi:1-acyl-sn-glycerol-3-phosphate acyltransferase